MMTVDRAVAQPTDGLADVVADIELARSLRYTDVEQALQSAQRGLQRLQQLQTPDDRHESTEAELRMLVGSFERQTGHLEASVVQYHAMLKLFGGRPGSRFVCEAWIGLGQAYVSSGDSARALRYSLLGVKTARALGLRDREAQALDGLGCVYAIFGDSAEALQHLGAAAAIARETGNGQRLCSVLNNLAMTLLGRDELASALRAGQEALRMAREEGLVVMELNVIDTVASILVASGDLPQAEELLGPAVSEARHRPPTKVLAELLTNLGAVRAASGDPGQAEALYSEALAVASAIGAPTLVRQCHKRLADLFAGLNRWQDAHREFRLYHEVTESIAGGRAATRLTVVRIADELDALQGDIESSEAQDNGLSHLGALEVLLARLQARNRELAEAKRAADAASDAKSRFLATMSHELRTPLNGMLGMAQLLTRTPLSDTQRRYCHHIEASGNVLRDLIVDILEYSRSDAGGLVMETVDFEPMRLVAEVVDSFRPSASARGLTIECGVEDQVPASLRGDAKRIRQVMQHLVDNALKFTAQGGVEVGVTGLGPPQGDSSPWFRFTVRDTGSGIDRDKAAALFQPFVQADSSSTRQHGGSGLGLAICLRLVESMGGRLEYASQPHAGSTFWFDIPLSLRPEAGTTGN